MALQGSCHCGAVRLSLAFKPTHMNSCHCSICSRYGTRWSYFHPKDVAIKTDPSNRATYQCNGKQLDFCRCANCGCVYACESLVERPRIAVNMRLFPEAELEGVEVKEHAGPE